MSDAQITIVVPSFNQGRYLNDALTSIFEQNVPVEVFVLDGGSTDNSPEILERWAPKLAGWRSHADKGQAAAINEGIERGSAPYVCWLNSDDFYYPDGLKKLLESLAAQPDKPFAYGKCWTVSDKGRKLSPYLTLPFFPSVFASFCFIAQPATLIRRAAWEKVNGLTDDLQMALDYDLWWRLYKKFGKPEYCRKFIASTRMHRDTKTANQLELHYRESMDTVKNHYGAVPVKWRVALPIRKIIRKLNK